MAKQPPELFREAVLDALTSASGPAWSDDQGAADGLGVQRFRAWPDRPRAPFVKVLRGRWQQRELSRHGGPSGGSTERFRWEMTFPLIVTQPEKVQRGGAEPADVDALESAIIALFQTKLGPLTSSEKTFTVRRQWCTEAQGDELFATLADAELGEIDVDVNFIDLYIEADEFN